MTANTSPTDPVPLSKLRPGMPMGISLVGFGTELSAMSYYNLSRLCEDQRKYDEAILYAERGLEVDPEYVECQRQIAHVLAAQGRINEALDAYKKVVVMSPADTESRLRIHELTEKKIKEHSTNN